MPAPLHRLATVCFALLCTTTACRNGSESTTAQTTSTSVELPPAQSAAPPTAERTLATHGGLQLRYGFAAGASQKNKEQTVRVVTRRLEAAEITPAQVRLDNGELVVELIGPVDRTDFKQLIAPQSKLAFARVDDDLDPWAGFVSAPDLPEGITIELENAPIGPGQSKPRHYIRMVGRPGEQPEPVLERLRNWTKGVALPSGRRVAYELVDVRPVDPADVLPSVPTPEWRTYIVHEPEGLGGEHIEDATLKSDGMGGLRIDLRFTSTGAQLFEQLTESLVKRRLAIIIDDRVESAPVVQEKIGGGMVAIWMGMAADDHRRRAERLAMQLRSGALPSPLELRAESIIGPAK